MSAIDPVKNERSGHVREVGSYAIWSLSSCKPGFGVDQLRDDRVDTYWQSDGQLPHLVNIQFQRKTIVSDIYIYTDYKLDESYTPNRISIRVGTHFNDLQEIEVIVLSEPSDVNPVSIQDRLVFKHSITTVYRVGGSFIYPVAKSALKLAANLDFMQMTVDDLMSGWVHIPIKDINDRPVRMFMIQIAVTSNHQNGRDTHMRQIKIHSPTEDDRPTLGNICSFSSIELQKYTTIR